MEFKKVFAILLIWIKIGHTVGLASAAQSAGDEVDRFAHKLFMFLVWVVECGKHRVGF